jgi:formylglycine-generating enzyme required for sulfatase activity
MKKLIPILVALSLFAAGCQLGGGAAGEPTALALPTTAPTNTAVPGGAETGSTDSENERVLPGDGMVQVFIPEGIFYMGGVDARASGDEKPVHQVTMNAFWIDKVEVTNGMYALCVQAGACRIPLELKSENQALYYANADFNDFPVIYVTWYMAKAYCEWAGRKLPTEAQWERAARGDDTRTYPWGDQLPDAQRANFNGYFGDTTKVGSFPIGASPFGVLDMAGNVAEWTNDYYDGEYYSSGVNFNPGGPVSRTSIFNRVVRGGTFRDAEVDIRVANRASVVASNVNAPIDSPEWLGEYSPRIGFRCASDN